VGAGFGGLVVAERIEPTTTRVRWAPLDSSDSPPAVHDVHTGGLSNVALVQRNGWTVLAAERAGRALAWHPVTGLLLADGLADVAGWQAMRDRASPAGPSDRDIVVVAGCLTSVRACDDGTIRLTAPSVGAPAEQSIDAHDGAVTAVVAWQRGRTALAASCGADNTVRLWDLERRTMVAETVLPAPADQITVLPGSAGDHIVVVTADDIIAFACAIDQ
jgi:WD40 repeat protein